MAGAWTQVTSAVLDVLGSVLPIFLWNSQLRGLLED